MIFIGDRYGDLAVLSCEGDRLYRLKCRCGKIKIAGIQSLSTLTDCGCGIAANSTKLRVVGIRKGEEELAFLEEAVGIKPYRSPTSSEWMNMWRIVRKYGDDSKVDPTWVHLSKFVRDMGKRPDGLVLGRNNPHLPYNKLNCRWMFSDERKFRRLQCMPMVVLGDRVIRSYTEMKDALNISHGKDMLFTVNRFGRDRVLNYRAIVVEFEDVLPMNESGEMLLREGFWDTFTPIPKPYMAPDGTITQ